MKRQSTGSRSCNPNIFSPDRWRLWRRLRIRSIEGWLYTSKVGLEPRWYTGAYRKYLSSLLPILHEIYGDDSTKLIAAYDAVLKVVFFDMDLALDTYFHSSMQKLFRLANYDSLTSLLTATCSMTGLRRKSRKFSVLNRLWPCCS